MFDAFLVFRRARILDEAALHAAERIRFKPASRDGQPYDSVALVHINFELAE